MDQALKDTLNQILGSRTVLVLTQIGMGVGLMYLIDKFFKFVEEKLTDDTKLEIAVWLLGRSPIGPTFQSWPETFSHVFERVFGKTHFTWRCFWRCSTVSVVTSIMALVLTLIQLRTLVEVPRGQVLALVLALMPAIGVIFGGNIVLDYVSMLSKRWSLVVLRLTLSTVLWTIIVIVDALVTVLIATYGTFIIVYVMLYVYSPIWKLFTLPDLANEYIVLLADFAWQSGRPLEKLEMARDAHMWVFLYPACFTSIWLWLYAVSGFLLKAARRFDIGFDWFNRKFDIEKKPLQSIGLVAGALVAVIYWVAVIVSRVVG